jgi:surface carbohydrate biosynthesis protein
MNRWPDPCHSLKESRAVEEPVTITPDMPHPTLILPIETKARELPGKLLLAAYAARRGFHAIVGDQRSVIGQLHKIPTGIYLDKSVARTKTAHYFRLRRLGFTVAAWCEEGLVYRDKQAYQFERVSPETMALVSAFFAWGEVHRRDVLEVVPEAEPIVHAFGNPRADLLREPYRSMLAQEARALVDRYGPYLLVTTTFSRFNRYAGREEMVDTLRARGFVLSAEQTAYYGRLRDHIGAVFAAFNTMIPAVAKAFPDRTVIVRPHPSENHEHWRQSLVDLPNVQVIYEGSVESWILGAEALIHNASTTGIEAYLLGRPVISYMPVADPVFNHPDHLPNFLSTRCLTVPEMIDALKPIVRGNPPVDPQAGVKMQAAERTIANISGPFAADRITGTLAELAAAAAAPKHPWLLKAARTEAAARNTAARLRRSLRGTTPLTGYMAQKFPGLSADEIRSVLDKIARAGGELPALRVTPFPGVPSCFAIEAVS